MPSTAKQAFLGPSTEAAAVVPDDAAIPIRLHPLVLLSVTDHVTRMKYLRFHESKTANPAGDAVDYASADEETELAPVLGVLLGQPGEGGTVGIVMSYEDVFLGADGDAVCIPRPSPNTAVGEVHTRVESNNNSGEEESEDAKATTELQRQRQWYISQIDWEAVRQKRERLREVFPECAVVGWYTVGRTLGDLACCAAVHENMRRIFSSDEEENGNGAATGRMLALMLEPKPVGLASATIPTYLYEVQLAHGPLGAAGEHNHRQRLIVGGVSAGASSVSFTPVRYELESEEVEHVAIDAALNIDLYATVQAQRWNRDVADGQQADSLEDADSGARTAAADTTLTTQAQQRGATMRATLARTRRSLLHLRLRLGLAVDYLSDLAGRLGGDNGGDWSDVDAHALRQLSVVASQLPVAPPFLAAAGPTPLSPTVVHGELASTLLTAALALESQNAVSLQALQRAQGKGWADALSALSSAVNFIGAGDGLAW